MFRTESRSICKLESLSFQKEYEQNEGRLNQFSTVWSFNWPQAYLFHPDKAGLWCAGFMYHSGAELCSVHPSADTMKIEGFFPPLEHLGGTCSAILEPQGLPTQLKIKHLKAMGREKNGELLFHALKTSGKMGDIFNLLLYSTSIIY